VELIDREYTRSHAPDRRSPGRERIEACLSGASLGHYSSDKRAH
jgi:hypothetical protein